MHDSRNLRRLTDETVPARVTGFTGVMKHMRPTNKRLMLLGGAFLAAAALAASRGAALRAEEHGKKDHEAKYLDAANAPKGKGWISLCNGKDLTGWVQRHKDRPMSWAVSGGNMINFSTHEAKGCDIYTEQKFDDFEIYYEYLVPRGSNSGLYLRGRYEIQILDDGDSGPAPHTDGAFYSVKAPSEKASLGVMKWQSVYAKIVGRKATVILNGKKIHDNFELPRPTGGELDGNVDQPGPIMLQGDHGSLVVRKLKLRPIGK